MGTLERIAEETAAETGTALPPSEVDSVGPHYTDLLREQVAQEDAEKKAHMGLLPGMSAFTKASDDALTIRSMDRFMSDETKQTRQDQREMYPKTTMAGGLLGSALLYGSGGGAVKEIAKQVPKATGAVSRLLGLAPGAKPITGVNATEGPAMEALKWLNSAPWKRVATATGVGAAEGAVLGANTNKSISGTAVETALGAGAGQVLLGELIPGAFKMGMRKYRNKKRAKAREEGSKSPEDRSVSYSARDEKKAYEALYDRLKENNRGMSDMALRTRLDDTLKELGPDATFADLDEAFRNSALTLLKDAPGYANYNNLGAVLKNRFDSMSTGFQKLLGSSVGNKKLVSPTDIVRQAKDTFNYYSPLYKKAIDGSTATTPAVDVFETVTTHYGYAPTKAAQGDMADMVNMFRDVAKIDGAPLPKGAELTGELLEQVDDLMPRDIAALLKQADELYTTAIDPFSEAAKKGQAKALATLRKALRKKLSDVPGLDAITVRYSDEHATKTAYEFGQKAVASKKIDEDALTIWMNNADDLEIISMIDGAKYALADKIADDSTGKAVQALLSKSSKFRAKLERALGDDTAAALVQSAQDLVSYGAFDKKAAKAMSTPAATGSSTFLDFVIAGTGAVTDKVSSAAAIGAGRRAADSIHPGIEATREAAGDILASKGASAADNLSALFNRRLLGTTGTSSDIAGSLGLGLLAGRESDAPQ